MKEHCILCGDILVEYNEENFCCLNCGLKPPKFWYELLVKEFIDIEELDELRGNYLK
ncbi:MAG: hypothetical protein GY853_05835 [PVC group bacterium]|nr:hypothetical protein [PVC group bacterium]